MPDFNTIVLATHNAGKVREIDDLLRPLGIKTVSAAELNLAEPDETELTFEGNARLKAVAAAVASGLPALSDDSGLAVDALGGEPGIYAARWAEVPASELDWTNGPRRDFDMAMWHVWDGMQRAGGPTTARFVCALCLAFPDGTSRVYEGSVEGNIVWPPRGTNGFGYDPIFQMIGDTKTCGEISPAEKHAKSHRADAFKKFLNAEFDQ
ncbi:RdgB/HAM1 family non-canonical purine NTP pyrophosphatase [Fretibacter rubidus]|uniref:RdgB/HAM1 family non-canonical purine NTP pyrophosphatase n=1 Tax=Fretibacter rubidus TaxID=570162 RepID=UPI00352AE98F